MAKKLGRKVFLKADTTTICAARTKTLTINNESIDVTTDCDDGVQQMLADTAQIGWELSVEGLYDPISTETTLLNKVLASDSTVSVELDYTDYTITGEARISSYSESLPYNEAITFSATLVGISELTKSDLS